MEEGARHGLIGRRRRLDRVVRLNHGVGWERDRLEQDGDLARMVAAVKLAAGPRSVCCFISGGSETSKGH